MNIFELKYELKKIVEDQEAFYAQDDNAFRDLETDHIKADNILLQFIDDEEVTELFSLINKWYA